MLSATVGWLLILFFAVLNGALRERVLIPLLGNPWALLLSGALLIGCVIAVAWCLVQWRRLAARSAIEVGAGWLAATLLFESGIGVLQGKSLQELLAPYRFEHGNVWPLVLLVVLLAPALASRWQARK